MHSPEAYISELKQLFNQLCHPRTLANTKEQLTLPLRVRGIFFLKLITCFASKMNSRVCHFACDILFCTPETCN